MKRLNLVDNVLPLSEFRANTAMYIERLKSESGPLVITQHGKSSAVLLGVQEYQEMADQIRLFSDVAEAKEQLARGEGIENAKFFAELKDKFQGK